MRSTVKTLALAVMGTLLIPHFAAASDDIEEQIQLMKDRMNQLEDQLQSTNDQLGRANQQVAEQQRTIERAGLEDERGSSSSLASFLENTEFSGVVAASYTYNFNKPNDSDLGSSALFSGGNNSGIAGNGPFGYPFHNDHNSFQVDEASISLMRAADENSRVGFGLEFMYGETASVLGTSGSLSSSSSSPRNNGGNDIWLRSAYIEYMGSLATVTAGKFDTHIGYETIGADENVNISRGMVYNLLQPVSQVGVKLSNSYDGGLSWMLGVVNGFAEDQPDINAEKDVIWQLGWGNDTVSMLFNGEWGTDQSAVGSPFGSVGSGGTGVNDERLVLGFVGELTPTDELLLWTNVTYQKVRVRNPIGGGGGTVSTGDPYGVGVSVGGRVALNDKMGVGMRAEFVHLDEDRVFQSGEAIVGDLWGVTATVDYAMTDALTLKVEAGYEKVGKSQNFSDQVFDAGTDDNQVTLAAQMLYEF